MAQGRSTEIILMIEWIRTSRLSIKNSLSLSLSPAGDVALTITTMSVSEGLIRQLDPSFDCVKTGLPYFVRYRVTLLIINTPLLGTCSRTIPRVIRRS